MSLYDLPFLFFLMIRRPPRSTRTDTLFPYPTLFRSRRRTDDGDRDEGGSGHANAVSALYTAQMSESPVVLLSGHAPNRQAGGGRSEERRVGKECVSTCSSRWSPYH